MPHSFRPSVVVAQAAPSGRYVFLTEADRWTADLAEAEVIEDEAHGDIRLLEAGYSGASISGVRLEEVRFGPRGPVGLKGAAQPA